MVIGYNPSHSNVNSEVNAPFKILSLILRWIEVELKPTNKRPLRPVIDMEEVKESGATGVFSGYQFKQKASDIAQDSGMRMDTMGGGDSHSSGERNFEYRDNEDSDQHNSSDD